MKLLNVVVGVVILSFGVYGMVHRRKVFKNIHSLGRVPMWSLEKKLVGESGTGHDRYCYVKYLLAQLFLIFIGLMLLVSSQN
ncbi:MAG: hypothetical protein KKD39_06315 [Candidatus Altiarchaeota archaeon]|nr:hypothetical protein [Candidatus Altiarchaeota archaeon]